LRLLLEVPSPRLSLLLPTRLLSAGSGFLQYFSESRYESPETPTPSRRTALHAARASTGASRTTASETGCTAYSNAADDATEGLIVSGSSFAGEQSSRAFCNILVASCSQVIHAIDEQTRSDDSAHRLLVRRPFSS
jgi:hypothetical protein